MSPFDCSFLAFTDILLLFTVLHLFVKCGMWR